MGRGPEQRGKFLVPRTKQGDAIRLDYSAAPCEDEGVGGMRERKENGKVASGNLIRLDLDGPPHGRKNFRAWDGGDGAVAGTVTSVHGGLRVPSTAVRQGARCNEGAGAGACTGACARVKLTESGGGVRLLSGPLRLLPLIPKAKVR